MSRPMISAVIPAYNSALFVESAISSILKQTWQVDEIIVVDDGSTDDTRRILEQYGSQVKYLYQENAGPSAARNRGVEAAKGNWIAFLDADDQWVPQKIEKQFRFIEGSPAALVAGDMAEVDSQLNITEPSMLNKHGLLSFFRERTLLEAPEGMMHLLNKNFIPTGTVLVKKNAFISAGGFDETIRFGEDLHLWVRIAALFSIACLPEVLMFRTRHQSNATGKSEKMLKGLVNVMISLQKWTANYAGKNMPDMNQHLAGALSDLGYYYFSSDLSGYSRRFFGKSLLTRPSARACFYYPASFLPQRAINLIRKMKTRTLINRKG